MSALGVTRDTERMAPGGPEEAPSRRQPLRARRGKLAGGMGWCPRLTCASLISIPMGTVTPSPPLRLLCAEAACHRLVLQGGERAGQGRLTPASREEMERGAGGRQEGRTHGRGEKKRVSARGTPRGFSRGPERAARRPPHSSGGQQVQLAAHPLTLPHDMEMGEIPSLERGPLLEA